MDVKTMFLHGDLEEQIYMEQPDRFTQPGYEHLVCKLKKSLYGLKQSPRQWYKQFDSYMLQIGYKRCVAKKILGMEIHRDRGSRKLWLSQRGYVEKVLDRFGMSKAMSVSTPLANHFKLSSEHCPKTDREIKDMTKVSYASAVGCLMYAMVCTRPDLAHAVSLVCKYMSKPKYMAVAEAAKEALWLNGLAKELGVEQGGVQLHYDNQSAIYLAKNKVYQLEQTHVSEYTRLGVDWVWGDYIAEGFIQVKMQLTMFDQAITVDKFNQLLTLVGMFRVARRAW
ncbi:UNVERIFIED_CONTAM: Retrovirus-related Pol polyprotein from transposon TNT 1-94 [Sesamum latifolium]|uniref:Retrovirus-related Pol polyprotein from transposon TNT 1-94 n=1 Tax=Sesamum latifolium TaxID=2727402 RepID=A0AAW2WT22_9LAMI